MGADKLVVGLTNFIFIFLSFL